MKKYLSLIVVLALVVACMIPAAFAANYTAVVGDVTVKQGTTEVKVPVHVDGTSIDGLSFSGFSATNGAKVVNVTSAVSGAMYFYVDNTATLIYADVNDTHLTGTLLYIHVELPADAIGEFEVTFNSTSITSYENNLVDLAIGIKSGKIIVEHDCVAGEWEIVKEPTCTEAGEKVQKCTLCDKVLKTEAIPALGHKEEVIPAVAATCTETGLTEGKKCSVCNEILVKQETVAALGHDWKDAGVANEGAYNCPDEKMNQKCSRCDATQVVAHPHECEEAVFVLSNVYDAEKKANVTTKQVRCIHSGDKGHGCTALDGEPWTEEVKDPITGDITPYIAMAALTLVAMVSAAAYLLKRKAI